jgi:hypothetical protein
MGFNYNSSQKFPSLVEINIAYAYAINIKKICIYIVWKSNYWLEKILSICYHLHTNIVFEQASFSIMSCTK